MASRTDRVTPLDAPSLWSQLADLTPTRAPDCRVSFRTLRGIDWAIVRNEANGTHVRVTKVLWELVERFDGQTSVAESAAALDWHRAANGHASIASDASEQALLASSLQTLERAGILSSGRPETAEQLRQLGETSARKQRRARWASPLALRIPLHDPDRWLDRIQPTLERFSPRYLGLAFCCLVVLALMITLTRWPGLTGDLAAMAGAPQRWWTLLFVWPLLKLAHESAHALMVRRLGGRVHEIGLGLLVLMPMPYVDASDASLFERRRDRALVSGAGMLAEGTLAMLALVLWSLLEPGLLREMMLSIVVAGTLSTVLFNANPLLRFDGYHLLQDLVDMPNLAPRSQGYWRDLVRTRWLGLAVDASRPSAFDDVRERRWLASYGVLATAYRFVVVIAIAWWLLDVLPLLGIPLALYAIWPLFVRPFVLGMRWLAGSPELTGRRRASFARVLTPIVVLGVAAVTLPLPSSTRATAIVALDGNSTITAPESGTLVAVTTAATLDAGKQIVRIEASALEEEAQRLDARIAALDAEHAQSLMSDPVAARSIARQRQNGIVARADLERRREALIVRAPARGRFVASGDGLLLGRDVKRGATLGRFVDDGALSARAVLDEADIGRLRAGVSGTRVRLAEAPLQVLTGSTLREMPSAEHHLPSPVLAGDGVDGIAVASVDERLETREPVFHVDVGLPRDAGVTGIGGRAYVTFRHAPEPLARRWWHTTRRLFLERLAI